MPITSEEYDNLMKAYDSSYADAAKALSEKADTAIDSISVGNTSVEEDITLPTVTENGVEIQWTSSDETIISGTGKINPPSSGDAVVELTASIIVKGDGTVRDQVRTKTFQVMVKQKITTPDPTVTPNPTTTPDATVTPNPQVAVEKVTGTKSTSQTSSIKLTWKAVSGATGYEVSRYNAKNKKYVKVATVTATTYTQKKLESATAYRYKVRAYKTISGNDTYGEYSDAIKVLTKPTKPTSVKAKRTTKVSKSTTGTVSFKKVNGATYYNIYKYNAKTKKYTVAYRVKGGKLYQYNTKTKKYKYLRKVTTKKGVITCKLTKLNLKSQKSMKFKIRAAVSKSGYTTQYSSYSKAVTIK